MSTDSATHSPYDAATRLQTVLTDKDPTFVKSVDVKGNEGDKRVYVHVEGSNENQLRSLLGAHVDRQHEWTVTELTGMKYLGIVTIE